MNTLAFQVLVALQALDAWVSWWCLAADTATEVNPLARWLIEQCGLLPAIVTLKIPILFLAWRVWRKAKGDFPGHVLAGLWLINWFYIGIVAGNISVYLKS